jgi:hypothetical protein
MLSEWNILPIENMNIEDHILALLVKNIFNDASEQELNELDDLSQRHPSIHDKINLLIEWCHSDTGQNADVNSYLLFLKILERINKPNRFEK